MILSGQLSSASQAAIAPQIWQATIVSSTAALRDASSPRRNRQRQQVRGFRFGLWSSYLDPAVEKELRRRRRIMKHKYVEALNRHVSWDWTTPYREHRRNLKNSIFAAWGHHHPSANNRWVNADELDTSRRHCSGRAGRGIEDVEQSAMEHLFSQHDRTAQTRSYRAINDYKKMFGSHWAAIYSDPVDTSKPVSPEPPASKSADVSEITHIISSDPKSVEHPEIAYEIDPITNRKVPRAPAEKSSAAQSTRSAEIPIKTFKSYRSQFSMFSPPIENEDSPRTPLNEYSKQSKLPPTTVNAETVKLEAQPTQSCSEVDLTGDNIDRNQPFTYNEPDGKAPELVDPVTESLKQYEDNYEPFKYNEPDGQIQESRDPVTPNLSESERRTSSEWLEGEGFFDAPGAGMQYDQHLSKSRRKRLPESSLSRTIEEMQSSYNSISTDTTEDLDLLRASDIRASSGKPRNRDKETMVHKEEERQKLERAFSETLSIDEFTSSEEAAAASKVKSMRDWAQELDAERSELLNHNAHAMGKVDAEIAELDASSSSLPRSQSLRLTGNYVRDSPEEFQTTWTTAGSPSQDSLMPKFAVSDVWSPGDEESLAKRTWESTIQSAENDYVTEFASSQEGQTSSHASWIQPSLDRQRKSSTNIQIEKDKDPYTKDPKGLEVAYAKECTESGEAEPPVYVSSYGCSWKPTIATEDKQSRIVELKQPGRDMEGKAMDRALIREVRDIYESRYGTIDCRHRQDNGVSNNDSSRAKYGEMDSLFGQAPFEKIEQDIREGQYLIQGAQLELAKILAARIDQSLTKSTTTSDSTTTHAGSKHSGPKHSGPEPTIYKILAYDPIMQSINIAETTSIVSDTSSALTPADVLLRLSNASKFFPHFKPLQEQGYEIASGGGDVLVFRKVRDSASPAIVPVENKPLPPPRPKRITNPIDGMQVIRPATGNFASPTGFVNHDLPEDPSAEPYEPLPPPPAPEKKKSSFKSNIDVRREEPVFSGRKTEWADPDAEEAEGSRTGNGRLGKRLLFTAGYMAACTYALGVVAEYFRTGGADGKGPVGF